MATMSEKDVRVVFDAAQKRKCDHDASDFGDWSPFGGSCWCADPNQPVVIVGLLAVAAEATRQALTAVLRVVRHHEGDACGAYLDVEKLLTDAGGTVPDWAKEDE